MPLSKDEILNADDCRGVELDMTPYGWPGTVNIGKLRGRDLARLVEAQKSSAKKVNEDDLALLCSLFIRDANGQRIFNDIDYKALSEKSFVSLQAVMDKGNEVNGLHADKIESAEKNSVTIHSSDSPSA